MQKGNIGVTTENIFPVIKKFLYSDHEIFLREMVSNAVDATQKLKTLQQRGDFKGELGDLTVRLSAYQVGICKTFSCFPVLRIRIQKHIIIFYCFFIILRLILNISYI